MRILFIKQLFNPEPTAKALDFALELKKNGHEVQVLTGFPSYPLGRIYEGYRQKLWSKENIKGIEIIRVPIYPDHSQSGTKRMLHYLSYAISASLLGPFLVKKADVAFAYQGAIPVGIPAYLLKKLRNIPFVYDINDLWPDTVAESGMLKRKSLLKFVDRWCQWNYRHASRITVATPGFKERLIQRRVPATKIDIVPNWCRDEIHSDALPEDVRSKYFPIDYLNILYAGNLGRMQSLYTILDAAKELGSTGLKVRFVLMGDGIEATSLKQYRQKHGISNVIFLPRVTANEVSYYLNSADVLLVHLKNTDLFDITIPSKILSYMKSGKPVLLGMRGNAADLIENSGGGWKFEPDNVEDLVVQVKKICAMDSSELSQIGLKGKDYYHKALSIESSTQKLITNFKAAINNHLNAKAN